MYKILVCGGRGYSDRDKIYHVLDAELARRGPGLLLINGGAPGADTIAREWAVDRHVDHVTFYAKWDQFGKAAGPMRNARMARLKPKRVFAFHPNFTESRGTADMVKKAERLKIKVKKFS